MEPYEKIAKVLRTDKDFIKAAVDHLAKLVGHDDIAAKISDENDKEIADRLANLGIKHKISTDIYKALINRIADGDRELYKLFRNPVCDQEEGCKTLLGFAKELANVGNGFFLKKEVAEKFLRNKPPQRILKHFGFKDVEELLNKYSLYEVYSALRFIEDPDWLNTEFFSQLESVRPQDFEERNIVVHVLHSEWLEAAKKFMKKKFHNVSHLKELGIIFIIPIKIDATGETLRLFSLILHYLHEISFYSKLFRKYAQESQENFAKDLISALRGDVLDFRFPDEDRGVKWMIVQRYLAKLDEYDWRLFEPHINPEALHWSRAEADIARLSARFPALGLEFWKDLDHVGDFFPDEAGFPTLVSFDLVDLIMSLVQSENRKIIQYSHYLYHHQEALWNKIFIEFLGMEKMEELLMENFNSGFIDLSKDKI